MDVIVFNPPWLLAKHNLEEGIDKAMYYEEDLFPRFFEEAKKYLKEDGKLVLIFSNLAQEVDNQSTHPIIEELQKNNRFRKDLHLDEKLEHLQEELKEQIQGKLKKLNYGF